MKDRMIRQAWDSVNPSQEQKSRMRSALEAKLKETPVPAQSDSEETPILLDFTRPETAVPAEKKERTQKKSPPRHEARYSPGTTARRNGALTVAAVLLMLLAAGGLYLALVQGSRSTDPQFTQPIEETFHIPMVTEPKELPNVYQEIVDTYLQAIQEGWTMNQCWDADLSGSLSEIRQPEDLGYTLRDLDSDGTQELIITDGIKIHGLYTMAGNEARVLVRGSSYETYTLSQEGAIHLVGVPSSTIYYYYTYTLEKGALKLVWNLCYDWEVYPNAPWHILDNETGEHSRSLSEENARNLLATIAESVFISHTPLTGEIIGEKLPDEASLPVYAKALRDWEESYNGSAPTTYTFHDFDTDGEQELIIGEGKTFLFAVKNVDGKAKSSVIRNGNSNLYLCEDGVILTYVDAGDIVYYTYSKMETMDQGKSVDYLVHDVYANTWIWKEHESFGLITEKSAAEAQAIIDSHPKVKLKWRSITEFPGIGQVSARLEEEQLLSRYAQAIPEALQEYSKAEDQTFCFHDIDGDGKAELLLGAGNSIYRILQPRTAEDPIEIFAPTGEQSDAYLCEGNVLEISGYAQGNNQYIYVRISDTGETLETEQTDYIFYSPETKVWYLGGPGINTPMPDDDAQAILASHPRVSLNWQPISAFPAAITGDVQSGTALFEKIFMGLAQGKIGSSKEAFLLSLEYYGFPWKEEEGSIRVQEPDSSASYLSAELINRNGVEEVYILDYVVTEADQQRIAAIHLSQEGTALSIAANPISAGRQVETPQELRTFIQRKDERQLLEVLAREYTQAYFHQDWNYLSKNQVSSLGNAQAYTHGDATMMKINAIKGAMSEEEIAAGTVTLSAECRLIPESDSYIYLTLEFKRENGLWKVSFCGLEG